MFITSATQSKILVIALVLSELVRTISCYDVESGMKNKFVSPGRRSTIPRLASRFVPNNDLKDDDDDTPPRMSIENMTCNFFTQPLDHFVPRGKSPTFQQRYCIYDGYVDVSTRTTESNGFSSSRQSSVRSPIFFYTGNESPIEQYINHTGLMWELAPQFGARVIFVEHRYEGQSLPNLTENCMSYGSTIQTLADYADILQLHLNVHSEDMDDDPIAPVIAFGGSYGGMLSAWMRMKYPHLIAGAIAASAPIGGFPQQANWNMDGATHVLSHGIQQSYPPDKKASSRRSNTVGGDEEKGEEETNYCLTNLLATWPLISWLVQEAESDYESLSNPKSLKDPATFLQDMFRLCEPYASSDPEPLLQFATSLWFDLAEGSFPYPSSYIPFALLHKKVNLPAWPMQKACWSSGLHEDWGITFEGNMTDVLYDITYGDSNLTLSIDWGNVSLVPSSDTEGVAIEDSNSIVGLLTSVRKAISVWYNVTEDVQCFDLSDTAPNEKGEDASTMRGMNVEKGSILRKLERTSSASSQDDISCEEKIKQVGSWEPVCCNDEINLVMTEAQGLGRDFFWPPSLPRGVRSYSDAMRNLTLGPCSDPRGIFGYSREDYDPWSNWMHTYYGSSRMSGHSNIVFSNGLLDPWSAGGVYATSPWEELNGSRYSGPMVQNITDRDVVAVIIEFGGHHTDLMYSNKMDPDCVKEAREVEKSYIAKWINEWQQECVL